MLKKYFLDFLRVQKGTLNIPCPRYPLAETQDSNISYGYREVTGSASASVVKKLSV
jgi:hypothetical protein